MVTGDGVVARHSVNNMYGHCGTVVLTGCCVVCVSLELVLHIAWRQHMTSLSTSQI
jgi:hypothetical protein